MYIYYNRDHTLKFLDTTTGARIHEMEYNIIRIPNQSYFKYDIYIYTLNIQACTLLIFIPYTIMLEMK